MSPPGVWHRLDRALARVRVHRRPLSLLIDGMVIALCWNATYLFRLGFERWLHARPGYDGWVMLGVVGIYLGVFVLAGIPRGMWRFSGFGEIRRLTLACLAAGMLAAVVVLMAQLSEVPRAVLALHPFVALIGLCMVRVAYRMLYEHARARITGSDAEVRRAIVMGAGEAATRLLATIHQQGWTVLGLLDGINAAGDFAGDSGRAAAELAGDYQESEELSRPDYRDSDNSGKSGTEGNGKMMTIADPLEPFNRAMFQFNDKLYFWVLSRLAGQAAGHVVLAHVVGQAGDGGIGNGRRHADDDGGRHPVVAALAPHFDVPAHAVTGRGRIHPMRSSALTMPR